MANSFFCFIDSVNGKQIAIDSRVDICIQAEDTHDAASEVHRLHNEKNHAEVIEVNIIDDKYGWRHLIESRVTRYGFRTRDII